jgi:hypothetical protein
MLNFINSIPEELGWVLVGSLATITIMLVIKMAKEIIIAHKKDYEEE